MKEGMKQRLVIVGLLLFVVFGGLINWNLMKVRIRDRELKKYANPAVVVSVQEAKKEVWNPTLTAVGTTQAIQTVEVTTQVAGKVTKILFEDGQSVEEGDLLIKLDDSVQLAQLENALAEQKLAATAVRRFKPLLIKGAISPYHMDKLNAQLKEAQAQVAQAQANLDHVHIKAPFEGRLGIRQVNLGEFLKDGQGIVTLDTIGTLYVDFTLPENDLGSLQAGQKVSITTDTIPGKIFEGTISAISPQIDPTTRAVSVRATFPNEDNALKSGIYVQVNIHLPTETDVVTVPKTAVAYTLFGDTVYVLAPENPKKPVKDGTEGVVKRVTIKPGAEMGTQVAILEGLQGGEFVVTSGQLKVQDGSKVVVKQDKLVAPETMPLN